MRSCIGTPILTKEAPEGEPDGGNCNSFTGYHIREGVSRRVDLSGLSLVSLVQIPGNVADGNWSEVLFVDARATDEQHDALVDAFQGRLGGPLADLAGLITDRRAQYRVPIEDGVGTVKVGRPDGDGLAIDAVMEPYRGPDGEPTRLVNPAQARTSPPRATPTASPDPNDGRSPLRRGARGSGRRGPELPGARGLSGAPRARWCEARDGGGICSGGLQAIVSGGVVTG